MIVWYLAPKLDGVVVELIYTITACEILMSNHDGAAYDKETT